MAALNNKTAKVHRLARLLQDHSEGLGISHISDKLGVDERTVKRYLSDLRKLKYDVVQDRNGPGRKSLYHIRPEGTPPGHFLPGLKKIRADLYAGGNPKYTSLIDQLIRFLEANESPKSESGAMEIRSNAEAYHIDHGPFAEIDPPANILKILESAIAGKMAVRLSYSKLDEGSDLSASAGEFLFFPYALSLRVGTLYLIGRNRENTGDFKSLSVKRIKRCQGTGDVFIKDAFDPAEFYKFTFGQWARQRNENPEKVLLAVRANWLEKYLAESHFNPPGRILKKGKEVHFEVKLVVKPDFVNWVISLAPDLIPLEPEGLRVEVAQRLKRATALLNS